MLGVNKWLETAYFHLEKEQGSNCQQSNQPLNSRYEIAWSIVVQKLFRAILMGLAPYSCNLWKGVPINRINSRSQLIIGGLAAYAWLSFKTGIFLCPATAPANASSVVSLSQTVMEQNVETLGISIVSGVRLTLFTWSWWRIFYFNESLLPSLIFGTVPRLRATEVSYVGGCGCFIFLRFHHQKNHFSNFNSSNWTYILLATCFNPFFGISVILDVLNL